MLAIKSVYDCVDGVFYPFFQQIHYPQNMGVKETWKLKKKKVYRKNNYTNELNILSYVHYYRVWTFYFLISHILQYHSTKNKNTWLMNGFTFKLQMWKNK